MKEALWIPVVFDFPDFDRFEAIVARREAKKGHWGRKYPAGSRVLGLQAEYAVARYLGEGAEIDERDYDQGIGDDGCDVRWDGKCISVRTVEYEGRRLLVRPGEAEGVDIFAHTFSIPLITYLIGWITPVEFFANATTEDPNNIGKPCHFLDTQYLRPFKSRGSYSPSSA